MRIGIRPINDFAFKKIFGTAANKLALISFLNAVLRLRIPIVDGPGFGADTRENN